MNPSLKAYRTGVLIGLALGSLSTFTAMSINHRTNEKDGPVLVDAVTKYPLGLGPIDRGNPPIAPKYPLGLGPTNR